MKSKVSYGAQSNQKIEAFLEIKLKSKISMTLGVIKKLKPFLKSKISYGAQCKKKIEAFFEII